MASSKQNSPVSPDTPITVKITVNDAVKKLKLPLRDLGVTVLPAKLRSVLDIKPEQHMILERYSDSVGGYITLDESNPQVFKTLIRAAKAKLKLRLKATVTPLETSQSHQAWSAEPQMVQTSTDTFMNNNRSSKAVDHRSVGSGIFQFREARASQQTLVNDDVPVPHPFFPKVSTLPVKSELPASVPVSKPAAGKAELPASTPKPAFDFSAPRASAHAAWSVYCNACDSPMLNTHFHCSICDDGDYDLCEKCVANGKMCPGDGHWLIKRSIVNGQVVNGMTERVLPNAKKEPTVSASVAQAADEKTPKPSSTPPAVSNALMVAKFNFPTVPTRTCNNCVVVRSEHGFVTCSDCKDFDLCIECHIKGEHGHHPAHAFQRATAETILPLDAAAKLTPGRNVRHNAICDHCDKMIHGVRHKCLRCPDWDYCNDCIKDAPQTHPQHPFAALYEPIGDQQISTVRHFGIFCDGPICHASANQSYIRGVRYKCTICHDTDFCANCEASPSNHHNRTHPMLKLKTPVRNVNIMTENADASGTVAVLGDRQSEAVATRSTSTETIPVTRANAATQVQTVAEITPTEVKPVASIESARSVPLDTLAQSPVAVQIPIKKFVTQSTPPTETQTSKLNAHFVHDRIADGAVFEPETRFNQVWTLKNPGPFDWPEGCSVRFVGGDNMLNVDNSHPASANELMRATESNVIAREVRVGEEVAFTVTLKAGKREGKSISYWRLKAADGTPFGHRLWCDIEVKKQMDVELPGFKPASTVPLVLSALPIRSVGSPSTSTTGMSMPGMFPSQAQGPVPDLRDMNVRLTKMREAQKERRDKLAALMAAQREQRESLNRTPFASLAEAARQQQIISDNASMSPEQDEHHEMLKQRVAAVKASILETRAQRELLSRDVGSNDTVAETVAAEKEEMLDSSQMVFPKLEKESPSSSTYQSLANSVNHGKVAYVENDEGEIEQTAIHPTELVPDDAPSVVSATADDEGDFESVDHEIEVLSATGEDSDEDDGFATDEEYDILDASDDETVASMK